MSHACEIEQPEQTEEKGLLKLKGKLRLLVTPSPEDPFCVQYFRSKASVRQERARQLSISGSVIHPCSEFRKWYEIYLIFLYTSVLITKPLDAGFFTAGHYREKPYYQRYTVMTDFLCWIDIAVNFLTGFAIKKSRMIELRPWAIAKNYISSPFFICDVLSSIPKSFLYFNVIKELPHIGIYRGMVSICCLLKLVRLLSLLVCIDQMAYYVKLKSKGTVFFLCSLISVLMIVHWMACLQFFTTRVIRVYFLRTQSQSSWIYRGGLHRVPLLKQYIYAAFRSSAYILGIRITKLYEEKLPEEYIIAIFTYVIGKVLVVCVWIVLAQSILATRTTNIKFVEIINQLDEYMRQKQLPLNLQERILHYYRFKYQGKYFKEQLITGMLSSNIKKELNIHLCRSLIANVSLFSNLTAEEVSKVVQYLIPEIFLPNDTIFRCGTYGDGMYFLSSGTVAVYTHSGKEVCHLEDGAYFGELALLLKDQERTATIVAIETSQVYKLYRSDFERCLLKNPTVLEKMVQEADQRLKVITKMEDDYKKALFAQTYKENL